MYVCMYACMYSFVHSSTPYESTSSGVPKKLRQSYWLEAVTKGNRTIAPAAPDATRHTGP